MGLPVALDARLMEVGVGRWEGRLRHDLERENPCLIGGDNLTGSHHLDQNFVFRPIAGYSRYATPTPRLYLCGAGTWPGAGTGAASGAILARMLAR